LNLSNGLNLRGNDRFCRIPALRSSTPRRHLLVRALRRIALAETALRSDLRHLVRVSARRTKISALTFGSIQGIAGVMAVRRSSSARSRLPLLDLRLG
jgi:hypothetical protein